MLEWDKEWGFPEKPNDVLTVGELLVDMMSSEYGDDQESNTYNRYFGGSPSNIAMNVRKLGIRSRVASAVGEDGLGRFLIGRLEEAGMDTSLVQRVGESTSMVVVTKSRGTPVPIFYRGADYHLGYDERLEAAVAGSKVVHFSCWPVSKEPSRGTIAKVMEEARRQGALIGFDPNYHPMIWQRGEDGLAFIKSLIGQVDIIKPSEDDAERLFGPDTPEKQLEKFMALGAKLVILTLGKDGALVSYGRETVHFPTVAERIVDTTGAGDAFWSGFYSGLVKGFPLRQSLRLGFAVSAYKLQFAGAVVDLPRLETIQEAYGL